MIDAAKVLHRKHVGKTAWIVGLGASIRYLNAKNFGPGPIITMNGSIKIVQSLGLRNQIYSLQKDGCDQRDFPGHQCSEKMFYPPSDIPVILPRSGYGEFCLKDHPKRLWLDYVKSLELEPPEMSIRIAVGLALRILGCSKIAFVSCDSLMGTNPTYMRRYYPETGEIAIPPDHGNYVYVRPLVLEDVRRIPHFYVMPKKPIVDYHSNPYASENNQPFTLDLENAD